MDYGLIRAIETTTASVHDSTVDLSEPSEVVHRARACSGVPARGYSATMKRAVRGHPIGIKENLRNKRISRKRAPVERTFAVIKNVFDSGHMLVTTVARVDVKMMFASFGFNLYQLRTLKRNGVI